MRLFPAFSNCIPSSQDRFHYLSADICQPEMAALEFVGQARVVDPDTTQDGGLQIVHMDRVIGDVVTSSRLFHRA